MRYEIDSYVDMFVIDDSSVSTDKNLFTTAASFDKGLQIVL